MNKMISIMDNLISISEFNKGEAGKIFGEIKKNNTVKLVLKHNEPECILISPEAYKKLIEELEDLRDYKMAMERLSELEEVVSDKEVMAKLNINPSDIDKIGDVEFD